MSGLRQALFRFVSPRLRHFGYEYDDGLGEAGGEYGYLRQLDGGVYSIILFQSSGDGKGFTVYLTRRKPPNLRQWWQRSGLYEGALGARLGHVLWHYFGLRVYSVPDHWWTLGDAEAAFGDVLRGLERYGIPWLEDPRSYAAGPLGLQEWNNFQVTLLAIAAPRLAALGYEAEEDFREWHPSRGKPQYYFGKELEHALFSYVVFHPFGVFPKWAGETLEVKAPPTPSGPAYFDVLLFRKQSKNPYDQDFDPERGCFQIWLSRHATQVQRIEARTSAPPPWKYSSQDELEGQLQGALDTIERLGIPLLEKGTDNQGSFS